MNPISKFMRYGLCATALLAFTPQANANALCRESLYVAIHDVLENNAESKKCADEAMNGIRSQSEIHKEFKDIREKEGRALVFALFETAEFSNVKRNEHAKKLLKRHNGLARHFEGVPEDGYFAHLEKLAQAYIKHHMPEEMRKRGQVVLKKVGEKEGSIKESARDEGVAAPSTETALVLRKPCHKLTWGEAMLRLAANDKLCAADLRRHMEKHSLDALMKQRKLNHIDHSLITEAITTLAVHHKDLSKKQQKAMERLALVEVKQEERKEEVSRKEVGRIESALKHEVAALTIKPCHEQTLAQVLVRLGEKDVQCAKDFQTHLDEEKLNHHLKKEWEGLIEYNQKIIQNVLKRLSKKDPIVPRALLKQMLKIEAKEIHKEERAGLLSRPMIEDAKADAKADKKVEAAREVGVSAPPLAIMDKPRADEKGSSESHEFKEKYKTCLNHFVKMNKLKGKPRKNGRKRYKECMKSLCAMPHGEKGKKICERHQK